MVTRARDGRTWRIGTPAEVAWIANGTSTRRTVAAAIPPVFEAYATAALPYGGEGRDEAQARHDRAVLALLGGQSPGQPWWLGYLDTGADDIVFPDAPKVTLYSGWDYVLVEAGPEQAEAEAGNHRPPRQQAEAAAFPSACRPAPADTSGRGSS